MPAAWRVATALCTEFWDQEQSAFLGLASLFWWRSRLTDDANGSYGFVLFWDCVMWFAYTSLFYGRGVGMKLTSHKKKPKYWDGWKFAFYTQSGWDSCPWLKLVLYQVYDDCHPTPPVDTLSREFRN